MTGRRPRRLRRAFTLIELLVVMAIIGILAAAVIPQLTVAPKRAKEAVLKEDLFTLRSCIDQYYAAKQHYPASLEALKQEKYIRKVPVDPFTKSADTWVLEYEEPDPEQPSDEPPGIVDVHSGSTDIGLDNTPYNTW